MTQALNDTARGINHALWKRRQSSPSVAVTSGWHDEFIAQGLDRKQSFAEYRKFRMRQWYKQRKAKK